MYIYSVSICAFVPVNQDKLRTCAAAGSAIHTHIYMASVSICIFVPVKQGELRMHAPARRLVVLLVTEQHQVLTYVRLLNFCTSKVRYTELTAARRLVVLLLAQ